MYYIVAENSNRPSSGPFNVEAMRGAIPRANRNQGAYRAVSERSVRQFPAVAKAGREASRQPTPIRRGEGNTAGAAKRRLVAMPEKNPVGEEIVTVGQQMVRAVSRFTGTSTSRTTVARWASPPAAVNRQVKQLRQERPQCLPAPAFEDNCPWDRHGAKVLERSDVVAKVRETLRGQQRGRER
jgi:hypothetical protein